MAPIDAMVFADVAKSVPKENITGLSQQMAVRAYNAISDHLKDLQLTNGNSRDYFIGNAICSHLRNWWRGTTSPVSMIVESSGQYGISKGLFSSFPVTIDRHKKWTIVENLELDTATFYAIDEHVKYLIDMRDQMKVFLMKEKLDKSRVNSYISSNKSLSI
ncbi:probable malate dehydrogenase 2, mitochondrial [Nilaparvata lugens]|uniref:probable malate dehydrogenase 2, mitochondrial n=1 Tax=Nilaparvata lugens TaxID=108931 RepID=UPI00193D94CF|nr:probable malate dehydrogenase 2, mitochondrial [Nilaparvata lugens]